MMCGEKDTKQPANVIEGVMIRSSSPRLKARLGHEGRASLIADLKRKSDKS